MTKVNLEQNTLEKKILGNRCKKRKKNLGDIKESRMIS